MEQHPGLHYRDFISQLVGKRPSRNYLEIGVRDGRMLSSVDCDAIGVDPNFTLDCNPIGNKRRLMLYRMTSDEFFRSVDVKAMFGGVVDTVFLDGLHIFEFLLRDFINSEKLCSRNSLIMLDDCLPLNVEMTERYHQPEQRPDRASKDYWTGDVWKMLEILSEYRKDLRVVPVDVVPTGCICITNLDPQSTVLEDRYFEIVDRYRDIALDQQSFKIFRDKYKAKSSRNILHGFDWSLDIGV